MKQMCDIFLPGRVQGELKALQMLKIFAPEFTADITQTYSGFLGLNLRRMLATNAVVAFRNANIRVLNIPIRYRDEHRLSEEEAMATLPVELLARPLSDRWKSDNPMYYMFDVYRPDEKGPMEGFNGVVVDSLDGHIWCRDEQDEYNHDYNHLL